MKSKWINRLGWRFLIAGGRRTVFLAGTIVLAVSGIGTMVMLGGVAAERSRQETLNVYGSATMWLTQPWVSAGTVAEIQELLDVDSVAVSPWMELDAFLISESGFQVVRAVAGSPLSADGEVSDQDAELLVFTGPESADFINLNRAGIWWTTGRQIQRAWFDPDALLSHLKSRGLVAGEAVGNALRLDGNKRPAVVAFDSAELVQSAFPGVAVRSSDELPWRATRFSLDNVSSVVMVVIIITGLAAVISAVLVSIELRHNELVLLSSLGFGLTELRRLITREVLFVSIQASAVGAIVAGIIGAATGAHRLELGVFVWLFALSSIVPPGTAFLAVRRSLVDGLHDSIVEFRQ